MWNYDVIRMATHLINYPAYTTLLVSIKGQVCRHHRKVGGCKDGNCQFYHPNGKITNENDDSTEVVWSNRSCWYEIEERFPVWEKLFFPA